jgi:hypothetical protein
MPSQRDDAAGVERSERSGTPIFNVWNRRLHYYLGLYFLFFCWLFAFTGLLLNHPRWQFAQFWPNRVQTTSEHPVAIVTAATPLQRARDVMRQLDLAGEIQWPATQSTIAPLAFQLSRPGLIVDVKVDVDAGRATIQRTRLNAWGAMHVLHTFTGLRAGDLRNERDWLLTTAWALSMEAVGIGLLLMVLSSYVMWYRLKVKRRGGLIALVLGFLTCGAFLTGLTWLR